MRPFRLETFRRQPRSAALDSISIASLLLDPQEEHRPRHSMVTGSRGMTAIALREAQWKLIFSPLTGAIELYNLAVDPNESDDLSSKEELMVPGMLDRLNAYFELGASRLGAIASGNTLRRILSKRDSRNSGMEFSCDLGRRFSRIVDGSNHEMYQSPREDRGTSVISMSSLPTE